MTDKEYYRSFISRNTDKQPITLNNVRMRDAVLVPSAQLTEQRLKRKIAMITNSYVISALEWLKEPKKVDKMVVTAEKKGLSRTGYMLASLEVLNNNGETNKQWN